jgi:hypothetical protein
VNIFAAYVEIPVIVWDDPVGAESMVTGSE